MQREREKVKTKIGSMYHNGAKNNLKSHLNFLWISNFFNAIEQIFVKFHFRFKVLNPKCSKYWIYTVAHTIDCVCSKMLQLGLSHGLFRSFSKLIPCPIHWIGSVLANLDFIFEF